MNLLDPKHPIGLFRERQALLAREAREARLARRLRAARRRGSEGVGR